MSHGSSDTDSTSGNTFIRMTIFEKQMKNEQNLHECYTQFNRISESPIDFICACTVFRWKKKNKIVEIWIRWWMMNDGDLKWREKFQKLLSKSLKIGETTMRIDFCERLGSEKLLETSHYQFLLVSAAGNSQSLIWNKVIFSFSLFQLLKVF